jgi:ketosteroid isomerase-like protein
MKRREFVASMGMLAAAMGARNAWATTSAPAAGDATAVRQAVENAYSAFYVSLNKAKYRSFLTDDYLLLENGELLDVEGDLAFMPRPEDGYRRADTFDFRAVKIHGDIAYLVYFLKSEITDRKSGTRSREWLESAILRRSDAGWRIALLHSTRIGKRGA